VQRAPRAAPRGHLMGARPSASTASSTAGSGKMARPSPCAHQMPIRAPAMPCPGARAVSAPRGRPAGTPLLRRGGLGPRAGSQVTAETQMLTRTLAATAAQQLGLYPNGELTRSRTGSK
jgi:hypothetical protein